MANNYDRIFKENIEPLQLPLLKQLLVLSRLRKIETIVKTKIEAMTIHYDIETDGLYLEGLEKGIEKGLEKGIEKGIEKGRTQKEIDFTLKLWALQEFSIPKMSVLVGVSEPQVIDIIMDHLKALGKSEEEARQLVAAYHKP